MTRKLQFGLHCHNCGDDIYSNAIHDYVTCHCGWWWVDGGIAGFKAGGTGDDIASRSYVSRMVEVKKLPYRYRDEVPEKREVIV